MPSILVPPTFTNASPCWTPSFSASPPGTNLFILGSSSYVMPSPPSPNVILNLVGRENVTVTGRGLLRIRSSISSNLRSSVSLRFHPVFHLPFFPSTATIASPSLMPSSSACPPDLTLTTLRVRASLPSSIFVLTTLVERPSAPSPNVLLNSFVSSTWRASPSAAACAATRAATLLSNSVSALPVGMKKSSTVAAATAEGFFPILCPDISTAFFNPDNIYLLSIDISFSLYPLSSGFFLAKTPNPKCPATSFALYMSELYTPVLSNLTIRPKSLLISALCSNFRSSEVKALFHGVPLAAPVDTPAERIRIGSETSIKLCFLTAAEFAPAVFLSLSATLSLNIKRVFL